VHQLIVTLTLTAVLVRNHHPPAEVVLVLGAALAATGTASWRMHKAFRASPVNFSATPVQPPVPIPTKTLRTGYGKDKEA
jgi:hypothetical protein